MALSPEEIEGREFGLSRRGYDRDEVDDFLLEVADTVRRTEADASSRIAETTAAQATTGGQADDTDPLRARLSGGPADTDDFGRLGAEVASVLRTADEAAAQRRAEADAEALRLRDEAEGYALRLREETEAEAARIRADADVEARNARTALEEATEQARVMIQQAKADAQRVTEEAEAAAGIRRDELLASAERQAAQAADVERDVHGRLIAVRGDLDRAVDRLDPEATAAVAASANEQASALDPADTALTDDRSPTDDPERLLGQGPPSPVVPPPAADTDATPEADDDRIADLPYDDEPLVESGGSTPDLDLTDQTEPAPTADDLPYAEDDDEIPPPPPPPPAPPGYEGAATDDLPYAEDDAESDGADEGPEEPDGVVDLRDDGADDDSDGDGDGDPLAAMVRDAVGKAVQGAMRRRPGADN